MFDLRRDIVLNTRVRSAVHDEATRCWVIRAEDGSIFSSTYLISAVGPLSEVFRPPFRGLEEFQGELYLAARWPEEADFSGKRDPAGAGRGRDDSDRLRRPGVRHDDRA
ncbi:hypothetical protein [Amycolatopsis jejuensis]|uniref:hypothetical protein n=1 Tax=Amycolatopsis jejuensis TaxID=330084 RepID=UPI000525E21E|nr:hypothetical protein [Amycolatopsis jejuensis]